MPQIAFLQPPIQLGALCHGRADSTSKMKLIISICEKKHINYFEGKWKGNCGPTIVENYFPPPSSIDSMRKLVLILKYLELKS